MPMTRAQKEQEVQDLKKGFESNEVFVVTHYSGLTVAEMTDLRGKLRAAGASYKVPKNTLAKRALEGTQVAKLADMLGGPVGVAASNDMSVTKTVYEFAKKHEKLIIVGGAMGAEILDKAGVEKIAKLPTLNEVRGMLVGLLQAPGAQLARLAKAYADKGGASAAAPAAEAPTAAPAAEAAPAAPAAPETPPAS